MARVLAGRGVGVDEVERYLDPTLRDLMPDPFTLAGMEAATERLTRAVERGEQVAIFGDYDVDGAASAALLSEYLRSGRLPDADPHPRPDRRGLRPECRGDGRLQGEGRRSRRHRRLRRGQPRPDRAGAARSASTSSCSTTIRRRRRCPRRSRWSIPTGRTIFPAWAISARPASSLWGSSRSIARCATAAFSRARSRRT